MTSIESTKNIMNMENTKIMANIESKMSTKNTINTNNTTTPRVVSTKSCKHQVYINTKNTVILRA
jgi:hypothetical protein